MVTQLQDAVYVYVCSQCKGGGASHDIYTALAMRYRTVIPQSHLGVSLPLGS